MRSFFRGLPLLAAGRAEAVKKTGTVKKMLRHDMRSFFSFLDFSAKKLEFKKDSRSFDAKISNKFRWRFY